MESKTYAPVEKVDGANTMYYQQPKDVLLEKLKKHIRAMNWLIYNNGKDVCYNCKEEGHFASQCPNEQSYTKNLRCYNCNELGHFANKCPTRQADDSKDTQAILTRRPLFPPVGGFSDSIPPVPPRMYKWSDIAEVKENTVIFGFGSVPSVDPRQGFVPQKPTAGVQVPQGNTVENQDTPPQTEEQETKKDKKRFTPKRKASSKKSQGESKQKQPKL
ncbi:uncharacterized protein LOC128546279 [Mercenaria mercenaria]|uniref:uncharacterized protein LOC128546279 n=1 Tax=Mercenaria mercenaria TaxID=6596 RepID=UPI00234F9B77|nr:uncharacterized protein LOC128546279 [Mercenaria mercenaria]